MKRFLLSLLILFPLSAFAQSPAELELNRAITNAGRWGDPRYTDTTRPTCNTSNLGAFIWNTTSSESQYCDGSSWTATSSAGITCATADGVLYGSTGACEAAFTYTAASNLLTADQVSVKAGAGAGTVRPGGLLCVAAADSATTGTGEEVLATCTLPANTFAEAGVTVTMEAFLDYAGTANKACVIELGGISGQTIGAISGTTTSTVDRYVRAVISRTGASTQRTMFAGMIGTPTALIPTVTDTTQTETNALDLVITCTTATIGEVIFKQWAVWVSRQPS